MRDHVKRGFCTITINIMKIIIIMYFPQKRPTLPKREGFERYFPRVEWIEVWCVIHIKSELFCSWFESLPLKSEFFLMIWIFTIIIIQRDPLSHKDQILKPTFRQREWRTCTMPEILAGLRFVLQIFRILWMGLTMSLGRGMQMCVCERERETECVSARTCVWVSVRVCVLAHACMCMSVCEGRYVYVYVCLCVCVCVCERMCVCVRERESVCVWKRKRKQARARARERGKVRATDKEKETERKQFFLSVFLFFSCRSVERERKIKRV